LPFAFAAASAFWSARDHAPLFLSERRLEMQHEGVGVGAEIGDDEGDHDSR